MDHLQPWTLQALSLKAYGIKLYMQLTKGIFLRMIYCQEEIKCDLGIKKEIDAYGHNSKEAKNKLLGTFNIFFWLRLTKFCSLNFVLSFTILQ